VSLGDHLRPDEDACLGLIEAREDGRGAALQRRDVGVEAKQREIGTAERARQLMLEPLGAEAVACERRGAAVLAAFGHSFAMAAVVAGDRVLRLMEHQGDIALGAAPDLAALPAGEEVRPAAAIEQDDPLAAGAAQLTERLGGPLVLRNARTARCVLCLLYTSSPSASAVRSCSAPRAARMSTISTLGRRPPSARAGNSSRRSVAKLSGRGVALPASSSAPAISAR